MSTDLVSVGDAAKAIQQRLERIATKRRENPRHYPEPTYDCICRDTGLIEHTEGTFNVGNEGRKVLATATEDHPVFTRCLRCNPAAERDTRGRRRSFGVES